MTFIRQPIAMVVVCLLLASCFMGCSVKLDVSAYDEVTDKQATAINGKVQKFLIKMAGGDDEQRKYKHHKAGYEDVLIDLMVLLTRTEARGNKVVAKNVKVCIIAWKAAISAHKGDFDMADKLTKGIQGENLQEAIEPKKLRDAYAASWQVTTAATPDQMETKRAVDFFVELADTFQQTLQNVIGTEFSKKEN